MTTTVAQILGVDISKDALDVHLYPSGLEQRFANTKKGFTALIKWLGGHVVERIVYEPTGAYHRGFETRFGEAGFTLAKVNPRHARRFAEAMGTQAKTDRVDARLLARFGAVSAPRPLAPTNAIFNELKDLLAARRALIKDRTAAQSRAHTAQLPLLKAQTTARLRHIEGQLCAVDAALNARIEADLDLRARRDILVSVPGLGVITAIALLIDMPELGALDAKEAASLAGLAPIARDSGQWRGQRSIRGGRAELRHALYMPAVVAAQFNPDLKTVYLRLKDAGKPAKVALVAVMRKLVILANALLKKGRPWTPKPA